ncbi:MAG TPA: TIGR03435 family protein [Acidobacteriaceae bacterium]|nr:TIGR03435 family protein [Acidobacteriaceae bacterium]
MHRFIAFANLILSTTLSAQPAAGTPPAFEVATIKPADAGPKASRYLIMKGSDHFVARDYTLKSLIAAAYDLNPKAISGGPSWVESNAYDILATTPGDTRPARDVQMSMLRALLAERFALTFHREPRVFSIYAIELAASGAKLKPTATPDAAPSVGPATVFRDHVVLPGRNASVADLATLFQRAILDRPVVDRTGLTGHYDFDLDWAPDTSQFDGSLSAPDTTPSAPLFTAIQQQLGLRLTPTKGPVSALIIDQAQPPTPN